MLDSDARELRNNTTLYIINDGTGTLPVFLNNTANPKLPKKGSYVEASGSLSVAAGNEVRMRARSVEQVAGVPVEAVDTILSDVQLGDVSIRQAGACMRACGRVVSFVEPRPGSKAPYKILLADHSGTLEVVHWFEPGRIWEAGDTLEAIGRVDLYRGKVQLKVQRADGLTHLE
jgi:DNA/RNA endonuclease YhcR with UshA esterase domain